ncbi:PQQ-binding-like beta-propeller repeat protein [Candidatus Uabimicrobium amorphum]|uniref:Dehydrogenase n=1 Tax=Uabimicrobium amorphum TaxID=2596890 RepID=A0A5S9INP1_UABAM|nr:PQQ-binding-like beta-propeller repeat protein [Candidatus Uabimicrobium amorphum]BBM84390.1 dehydrogenase [Candidatus Uabimicrobium amorphum]
MKNVVLVIILSTLLYSQSNILFTDPAVPKVYKIKDLPPRSPVKQLELTIYRSPKPLHKNATTHDWDTFLGPMQNGVSTETHLNDTFAKDNLKPIWEVRKGQGYAAVAVIGKRVILFHRIREQEVVECLHAENGKRFWKFAYAVNYRDRYGFGNGPRCQPISDGEYVYTLGVEGKLHCLHLVSGQVLWERDLDKEFNLRSCFFGVGSTPVLEQNLLVINLGGEEGPCVAAFDKRSGKMIWGCEKEWGASYASPIAANIHGKRYICVFAGGESRPAHGGLLVIKPQNGEVVVRFPWRARRYTSVNASSPLVIDNNIYLSECYGAGQVLLRVDKNNKYRVQWKNKKLQTHFMTAIYKDGYLYGIDGHGPANAPLVCIEAKTGKEMWRYEPKWPVKVTTKRGQRTLRLPPALASMILVDGRCLLLGQYGHLVWLDLNPQKYTELQRTHLFAARETWSMPSLSRGLLYVCQNDRGLDQSKPRLLCYDLRK